MSSQGATKTYYEVLWGIEDRDRQIYIDYGDGSWISQDARHRADRCLLELLTAGVKAGLFVNGEHKGGHDFTEEWADREVEDEKLAAEWQAYLNGEPVVQRRRDNAPERHFDLSHPDSCPDFRGWATKGETEEVTTHTPAAFDMRPYPAWRALSWRFWILAEVIAVTETTVTLRYLRADNTKGVSTMARPPALTQLVPQPHKISYSAGSERVHMPGPQRYDPDGRPAEHYSYFFRAQCSCGAFRASAVTADSRRYAIRSHLREVASAPVLRDHLEKDSA